MCLQHPPATQAHTQAESDRRSKGSLGISEQRSGFRNKRGPNLTIPICPHWPLEKEGALLSPDPGQKAPMGIKTCPSEAATRWRQYPSCPLGKGLRVVPHSLGTWGLSDQRQKHLDCALPCPPVPGQLMNTPHRASQWSQS